MPSKIFTNEEYILDRNGSPMETISSEGNRCFAVIVKCGHCGNGYFIPLMVCNRASDIHAAITFAKQMPRVKRDKKDAVIDAFEATYFEKFFIEQINDRNRYMLGESLEYDQETLDRRILEKRVSDDMDYYERKYRAAPILKTAEQYDEKYALERFCAPVKRGDNYVYPNHIDRTQLLNEIFKQSAFEYGIKEDNELFISLYYQYFGEPNDLNISFDGENFVYMGIDGEKKVLKVTSSYGKIYQKSQESQESQERMAESWENVNIQVAGRPSKIAKFNSRIEKHRQITGSKKQLGE